MAQLLDPEVYAAAQALGATVDGERALPKSVRRCPPAIAEFYRRIVWPRRSSWDAPDIGEIGLSDVRFEGLQAMPAGVVNPGLLGMDLFAVGGCDGDAAILLLDGADASPSDPRVYRMDHEILDTCDVEDLGPLSALLRNLTPV